MKSVSGRACAMAAVASPIPKPISSTSGARRPKRVVKSTPSTANGTSKRAELGERARLPGPDPAGPHDEAADCTTARRRFRGLGRGSRLGFHGAGPIVRAADTTRRAATGSIPWPVVSQRVSASRR
jgi:hypothetical protein